MHSGWAEGGKSPEPERVRAVGEVGGSHKIANPKATSEIMSSKAVQKGLFGGGGEEEKNGLVLKFFFLLKI